MKVVDFIGFLNLCNKMRVLVEVNDFWILLEVFDDLIKNGVKFGDWG